MASTWINQLGKGVDIGANQFLQSSVFQDICYDFVLVLQLLQYFLRGDLLTRLCLFSLLYNFQFIK